MLKKVKAVVSIGGDYCAWHEVWTGVDWVFGKEPAYSGSDFIYVTVLHEDDDLYSKFMKLSKIEQDTVVEGFIKEYGYEGSEYCDYEIRTVIQEFADDGELLVTYI